MTKMRLSTEDSVDDSTEGLTLFFLVYDQNYEKTGTSSVKMKFYFEMTGFFIFYKKTFDNRILLC